MADYYRAPGWFTRNEPPRTNRHNTEPRANITDPDVRVMRNQKGYVAGCNGQLVVTADQVIASAMLSQHPVDRTLLHPLLDTCRLQLTQAGIRPVLRTVLADSGYVSEENFARTDQDELRLLMPMAKDPARPGSRPPKRTRHLDQYPATARAIRRLRHPRGREDYKQRARTVEPVFGQLKTCQKLTMMSRRGLAACESEWLLACAAQPAQAAPAPPAGLKAQGLSPGSQDLRSPRTAATHPHLHSSIPDLSVDRALCDRLIYADGPAITAVLGPAAPQTRTSDLGLAARSGRSALARDGPIVIPQSHADPDHRPKARGAETHVARAPLRRRSCEAAK